MNLSTMDVLQALQRAPAPWSGYVAAELDREHSRRAAAGGKGFPARRSLILRRLRKLESLGLIKCTGGPNGYYGYIWSITEAGRATLVTSNNDTRESAGDGV